MQQEIENRLKQAFPDAMVQLHDVRGTGDHWNVEIASDQFKGLNKIKRHQRVYRALSDLLQSEQIHAIHIITHTHKELQDS